jgi:DnaJ-class molecular chaperone
VAVLGGKMDIQTIYGTVEVTITAGTQSGEEKRLINLGLPSMYSKQLGDQIVTFKISIPQPNELKNKSIYEKLGLIGE